MRFVIYEEKKAVKNLTLLGNMMGSKGTWRWRLVGSNGEPIAQGEDYVSKSDCEHAVYLVKSTNMLTPTFYL